MKSKRYGQNALSTAAGGQGAKPHVSEVAAANPEVNKFDESGNTELHNKSYNGNTKQMDRLLDVLADIDLATNDKYGRHTSAQSCIRRSSRGGGVID